MAAQNSQPHYIKGNLKDVPVPKLLNALFLGKKNGLLKIQSEKSNVIVTLQNGSPIHVTSNYIPNLALGELLCKDKRITPQELEYSLKKMKELQKLQGEVFIIMGILSHHELSQIIEKQFRAKIFYTCQFLKGKYLFSSSTESIESDVKFNVGLESIILAAITKYQDFKDVREAFAGKRDAKILRIENSPYKVDAIKFSPQESRVFAKINGQNNLKELQKVGGLGLTKTYQFIYALYMMNVVKFEGFESPYEKLPETSGYQRIERNEPQEDHSDEPSANFQIDIGDDILNDAMKVVDDIKLKKKAAQSEKPAAEKKTAPLRAVEEYEEEYEDEPEPVRAPAPRLAKAAPKAAPKAVEEDEEDLLMKTLKDTLLESTPSKAATGGKTGAPPAPDPLEAELAKMEQEVSGGQSVMNELQSIKDSDVTQTMSDYDDSVSADSALDELEAEILKEIDEPASDMGMSFDDLGSIAVNTPTKSGGKTAAAFSDSNDPRELLKTAQDAIDDGRYAQSIAALRRAVELDDKNPEYKAYLGWGIYLNTKGSGDSTSKKEAIDLIKQGIAMNQKFSRAYFFLGMIYKDDTQLDYAEMCFTKALEFDKNCIEAREELVKIFL